jgi:hypothetical protein
MSQGSVLVTSENTGSGETNAVERYFLYIGAATKNVGSVVYINAQSDLDDVLGVADSNLKTQIKAAVLNADGLFSCSAIPTNIDDDPLTMVDLAMQKGINPEAIVICRPLSEKDDKTAQEELADIYAKQQEIEASYHRFVFFAVAVAGITTADQSWSDYLAYLQPIADGLAAPTVGVVPQLHGNDLGAVCGRLCKNTVTVVDTPMRVKTGTMVGLGPTPVDKVGVELPSAVTAAIDDMRFSTTQTYPDFDGVYFGDFNLLDAEGGDFQVVEHLRVINKARRAVRIKAIWLIGDRQLNNSPVSESFAKRTLAAPLRAMAKATALGPGEIDPPTDDAISITWLTKSKVQIFMKIKPITGAKAIIVSISLDLSNEG